MSAPLTFSFLACFSALTLDSDSLDLKLNRKYVVYYCGKQIYVLETSKSKLPILAVLFVFVDVDGVTQDFSFISPLAEHY